MSYVLWICPVCRKQTDDDPEYGRGCYHAEYGADVDPVEVEVHPVDLVATLTTPEVRERLAEQKRRHETREAMWDWWRSQPQEWRDEQEAARRAKLTPAQRMTEDAFKAMASDMTTGLTRQAWTWSPPIHVDVTATTKEGE